jgi:hypothetical protein
VRPRRIRMHPVIDRELTHHQYLRARLEEEFPDADEETLHDTLEGLSNLPEMLAEVLRSMLDDHAMVSALKARIGDMQTRAGRIEERARKKRELVVSVMERADLRKLTEPDFTVSLRPSRPPLVVTEEEIIPADFWRAQPAKLDRQGLIAKLVAGREVPGALLGNAPMTISVRTK